MFNSYAIVAVLATAGYARAQSGLAVAMYVPHDLETLEGSVAGIWRGSFEAPLTTNLRGDKAEWAAFCVDQLSGTCFSEPISEIATGPYTEPGELIEFEVPSIDLAADVVCYVATVFEKGMQICSKPVLDYTVVGPVSNGNWNWAEMHNDVGRALANNPVLARISEAAKETVQMVQRAFGSLQKDAAMDIEDGVEAFSASELHQLLSEEIGAVAEKLRPKMPTAEAPAAEELQKQIAEEIGAIADMIRPEIAPIAEAPMVEAPAAEAPMAEELQKQIAEEIGAIADMIRPEIAPIAEAPMVEAPAAEAPMAEELQKQIAEEIGAIADMIRPEIAPIAEAPMAEAPSIEEIEVPANVVITPLEFGAAAPAPEAAAPAPEAAAPAPEAVNGPLPAPSA